MEAEPYVLAVGTVVLAVKSLEFGLRSFLDYLDMSDPATSAASSMSIGQTLPSSVLTSHATLGQLIMKFNESVTAAKRGALSLDPTLGEISETLADGHVWGIDPKPLLRLVAFSTPRTGLVSCVRDELMDEGWLETQARRLREAQTRLGRAGQEIHPDRWTPLSAGVSR
jgi:hypothetical protein